MNKNTTLFYLFILFYFFNVSQLSAAFCESKTNGEWSDPTTWNCNGVDGVPVEGDIIIIRGQDIVTIEFPVDLTTVNDDTPTSIIIHGTLYFTPPGGNCGGGACDTDLMLDTDSEIIVEPGGTIDSDNQGRPHVEIVIGGVIVLDHPDVGGGFPFIGPGTLPEPAPLPVELVAFHGTALERSNILKWQTASEENTMAFLLERSLDGRDDFKEIGRVEAFGNSTSVRDYEIEDDNPNSLVYYRLRIVDFDGTFEFSDVIAVERTKTEIDLVEVYPVPAVDDVTVLVHAKIEGKAIMTLSDFMGRTIKHEHVVLKAGINHYTFEFGDHETNFYYLTIYNGQDRIAKKILRASKD